MDWKGYGSLYSGTIRYVHYGEAGGQPQVESYDIQLDADSEDEMETEVPDEQLFEANDDDYWDEWNGLRQYAGQSLLKHVVKLAIRRRFICRFWHWRLVARSGSLHRRKSAAVMYAAMRHVCDWAPIVIQYFWKWSGAVRVEQVEKKGLEKFKADYETLIAHIHTIEQEKQEMGQHHQVSVSACWGSLFDAVANKHVRSRTAVFRRAVLLHREEARRLDTSLQDQVTQLRLANTSLSKELDDAQRIAAATAKDKRRLMQELGTAQDEAHSVMEELGRAQRDARDAIQEVRELRNKLKIESGGDASLTSDAVLNAGAERPGGKSPTITLGPAPAARAARNSRFAAISTYSQQLCADAGLDS